MVGRCAFLGGVIFAPQPWSRFPVAEVMLDRHCRLPSGIFLPCELHLTKAKRHTLKRAIQPTHLHCQQHSGGYNYTIRHSLPGKSD